MKAKINLLIADPCYERRTISNYGVPFSAGVIATYARKEIGEHLKISIVHSISKFYEKIESERFHVIAFSHYLWNANLTMFLAQHAKIVQSSSVNIFGGHHFPLEQKEQEKYLRAASQIDFFIEKDAEIAFVRLLTELENNGFNVEYVKGLALNSVRSIKDNKFITSPLEKRIYNLDEIPSPYSEGLMDEFLEAGFTPVVESNRGCPFPCVYCGGGEKYYSRTATHSLNYVINEYNYIAEKMKDLAHLSFWKTFYIADNNFGMYEQDLEISRHIKSLQEKYKWPMDISASMGKSNTGNIIKCIDMLRDSLLLTASVQSTDPQVLKDSKRKNIPFNILIDAVLKDNHKYRSYSEIILGLPGDSYERHIKSLKDMINCQVDHIYSHQLRIMPNVPLSRSALRKEFKLKTKFRFVVTGLARVKVGNELKPSIEFEEICVGNESMTFNDFIKARTVDLLVQNFYNDIFSPQTFLFFRRNNIPTSRYLDNLITMNMPSGISTALQGFVNFCHEELFDSQEALEEFLAKEGTFERLEKQEIGINPLYRYSEAMKEDINEFFEVAEQAGMKAGGAELASLIREDFLRANNDKPVARWDKKNKNFIFEKVEK